MSRSEADFNRVRRMARKGVSDYQVARLTGLPRSTVRNWRLRESSPQGLCQNHRDWRPGSSERYAYLLGLYLGDGHLWKTGRASWRLGITLDRRYPSIIREAADAVALVSGSEVCINERRDAETTVVLASSSAWPHAFPQHGPGKKHEREVSLAPWQSEITTEHPEPLVRGLIHSDGCRTTNRFTTKLPSGREQTYEYTRYFFSNLSPDIRQIFCDHCDLLGIQWSQSNPRNISIARRESVARLDRFVGPKR